MQRRVGVMLALARGVNVRREDEATLTRGEPNLPERRLLPIAHVYDIGFLTGI